MDYSKLSDREIDWLVLGFVFGNKRSDRDIFKCWERGGFKYTTNPADAWAIIVDKKICLAFDVFAEPKDGGSWIAAPAYGWEKERARHDNPLRAAMIVFLMMQEKTDAS